MRTVEIRAVASVETEYDVYDVEQQAREVLDDLASTYGVSLLDVVVKEQEVRE